MSTIVFLAIFAVSSFLIWYGYRTAKKKYQRLLEDILYEINGIDVEASHDKYRLQRARKLILDELDGI